MPKFTQNELAVVKGLLFEKGKALFIEYGLKKTSIDDIVSACDISKGSFYKFFPSKEELFFDIFRKEEENYVRIYESFLNSNENESELMTKLITSHWIFLHSNPFLRSLYARNEQELLYKKIPREEIQRYTEGERQKFIKVIKTLQTQGRINKMNPEVIVAMIKGVLIMSLQKSRIGEDLYDDVMNQMIQFIGAGLEKQGNN